MDQFVADCVGSFSTVVGRRRRLACIHRAPLTVLGRAQSLVGSSQMALAPRAATAGRSAAHCLNRQIRKRANARFALAVSLSGVCGSRAQEAVR